MAKGGARVGAGRKSVHDEIHARDLAINAIVITFGSLENGLMNLLKSEEPTLIKFVYEHAIGKPKDTLDIEARLNSKNEVVYIGKKKK
jgi:hypothetical protein